MDVSTIAALDCGSEELGIAWLIARRSSELTSRQIGRAADFEAMAETVGRLGRRAAKTVCRSRETFDERRHGRADHRAEAAERLEARAELARRIAAEIPDLAEAIGAGFTLAEAAEICGISRETSIRRRRELRQKFAAEFAEIA
jgi:hypothetical protein